MPSDLGQHEAALAATREAVDPRQSASPPGHRQRQGAPVLPVEAGYLAVFAIALDARPDPVTIKVDGVAEIQTVQVGEVTFPETDVVVEDELANPSKPGRERIDADNTAINGG